MMKNLLLKTAFITLIVVLVCLAGIGLAQQPGPLPGLGGSNIPQQGKPATKVRGTIYTPVWNAAGDKLAFVFSSAGNLDVFIVDSDGQNPINVTNHPNVDKNPVWGPDGSALAFVSKRNGVFDICIVDKEGEGMECPTAASKAELGRRWDDLYPTWSPDGATIAYCSYFSGYPQVWFMGTDGSNPRVFYERESCYPDFSANGRKLAFSSEGDLLIMDLKSERIKNITYGLISGNMVDDTMPVWAPKGNRLAFVGRYESFESEIYTISAAGKKVRRITDNLYEDFLPRWQPDGKGVIYSAFVRSRSPEIFVSDPMGPEKTQLTDDFFIDMSPAFSPDGQSIIFVRRLKGRSRTTDELYIMDKDGKNQRVFFPLGFNPALAKTPK